MMVAVAVLAAVILLVAQIFKISTEAAGRTSAQAEVISAAAAFREHVSDLLGKIEPGLLVIESPPPTEVRAEVEGGPRVFRLRHDRLVFIASGQAGEFQSFTDPKRGSPDPVPPGSAERIEPASSSQALITIGPGAPLDAQLQPRYVDGTDALSTALTASEWILSSRTILLIPIPPADNWGATLPTMDDLAAMLNCRGPQCLLPEYREVFRDAVTSSPTRAANAETLRNMIQSIAIADILGASPLVGALWESNYCPTTSSQVDASALDYYVRSGWNFQPRLADFRIEWTDGRRVNPNVNPPDLRTRWFGLQPSPGSASGGPAGVAYRAGMRGYPEPYSSWNAPNNPNPNGGNPDNPIAETQAFATRIEWSPNRGAANLNNAYRAVWRNDTWQYRPKALRFTYRIYDANNRLSLPATVDQDEDGRPDILFGGAQPEVIERYGQEFSIVVPLP